jgi:NAD+ diphosphatase
VVWQGGQVSVPTLARTAVDRAAERRDDAEWLAHAWETGRLLIVDSSGRAAIDDDGPALAFVESATWMGDR